MISVCMMVKNEEDQLHRSLSSAKQVADEIIVVDTGSTDKSVAIAESYGAKVYHHPWEDDFSLHRNQSINYATGDFIIILDADEEIVINEKSNPELVKKTIQTLPPEYSTLAVQVQDWQGGVQVMSCQSARIFRSGSIHYENRVHNQPMFKSPAVIFDGFTIKHYGYDLSPEKMRMKFLRTETLLKRMYEENPEERQTIFYLCQIYGQHGEPELSREWGRKYLELEDELGDDFNKSIYFTMIKSYQEASMWDEAFQLIKHALHKDPWDVDIAYSLSDQGALTNKIDIMAEGCRRFIRGYKECLERPTKMGGRFYFTLREDCMTLVLYRLCVASLQEGMEAWHFLKPRLSDAVDSIKKELVENLEKIGLPHLLDEVDFSISIRPLPKLIALK